jgi:hypothetical protein
MPTYPLAIRYCTDEDIAVRAFGDFGELIPRDQVKAAAEDGVIPASLWSLTSASMNFGTREVAEGDMVRLYGARNSDAATRFGPLSSGSWFAVNSVAGTTIGLRRKGMPAGIGEPAGGPAELSSVGFQVVTLRPQIEKASREINRKFGIDDAFVNQGAADIYDVDALRDACELMVLYRLYLAGSRMDKDDWKIKALGFKEELEAAMSALNVQWGDDGLDRTTSINFGRVAR